MYPSHTDSGKNGGVFHDVFKPFILHFDPSFGVHSFKEGKEVVALFERVMGYVCIPVHLHEPFKLCQKWHRFTPVSDKFSRGYPLQLSVFLLWDFLFFFEVIISEGVISRASWLPPLALSPGGH